MANIPRLRAVLLHDATLDTALSRGIYHKPDVPYCYYKLATNVIRAVKINVVMPVVYSLIYHCCQPISTQGSNHPVYNFQLIMINNQMSVLSRPCMTLPSTTCLIRGAHKGKKRKAPDHPKPLASPPCYSPIPVTTRPARLGSIVI